MVTRTSQSYLMATLKDPSVGVWLADGSTVAVPEGLPGQFLGTPFAIASIREKFKDNLHPGDVIMTNDPYHGGHNTHLPDWGFFRPIFFEGELVFFTLVRGHMMGTGGSFPGGYFANAYDIIAKGLCIPPLKVIKQGVEDADLTELIFNNVRWPDEIRIDTNAMIATTKVRPGVLGRIPQRRARRWLHPALSSRTQSRKCAAAPDRSSAVRSAPPWSPSPARPWPQRHWPRRHDNAKDAQHRATGEQTPRCAPIPAYG